MAVQSRQLHNNWALMALAAIGLAVCAAGVFRLSFGFDVWYMLATGREIVEHGIPYQNPFALQEDMGIIVQQWMLCVLFYGIYQLGGFVGLALWASMMSVVLMVSLYRLGRLVKDDRFGGEWLMMLVLVVMPACMLYIDMGSKVYSMVAYCWVVFLCEKYRRTGRCRWLALLFPLTVLHAGFHLAMAPFDLVIIGCYLLPDFLQPFHKREHLEGVRLWKGSYRRLPLLGALALAAIGLCINPYGIRGALYLLLSYGAADYDGAIPEMSPLAPASFGMYGYVVVGMLVLAGLVIGHAGLRRINLPPTLLALGTAVLVFQHERNMWLIVPFVFVLTASMMHGWSLDPSRIRDWWQKRRKPEAASSAQSGQGLGEGALPHRATDAPDARLRKGTVAAAVALTLVAVGVGGVLVWPEVPGMADKEAASPYAPTALVRAVEQDAGTKDVRLFAPVRLGAYLEWSGFKVWVDSRLEIWNAPISGSDHDYYTEYVDMCHGRWYDRDFEVFLAENDFDYLITEKESQMEAYLEQSGGYATMLGTGDYELWKKA